MVDVSTPTPTILLDMHTELLTYNLCPQFPPSPFLPKMVEILSGYLELCDSQNSEEDLDEMTELRAELQKYPAIFERTKVHAHERIQQL